MIVVGLSGLYHDAACALMVDGRVVAAVHEERLTRRKGDPRLPVEAWRWCLDQAGVHPGQVDAVAWYEDPDARVARRQHQGLPIPAEDPKRAIRERLGFDGPVHCFGHHQSHQAAAFLLSPHDDAAVATIDAVGGWLTATWGRGALAGLETLAEWRFPHSLGLLYSTVTSWLGFPVLSGEARVMGLAGWGTPTRLGDLRRLAWLDGPQLRLDTRYFDFGGPRLFSPALLEMLGPSRVPGTPLRPRHADVAASLQALLEEVLLAQVGWLHDQVGGRALCLGGGVALNCAANGRLLRDGPYADIWVQPAAGDAGSALGAAALAWVARTGRRPEPLEHVYLGPDIDADQALAETPVQATAFRGDLDGLCREVVARLEQGHVVGWARGRTELGPRALGARSMLADPRRPEMRDRLNAAVKRREGFRPFAPCVLLEDAAASFGCTTPSPHMLFTFPVLRDDLPAITHADGTARVQTVDGAHDPGLATLLRAWKQHTGCPVLLNTSLNVKGQPIASSGADALEAAADAGLDALVLGDHLVLGWPDSWPALVRAARSPRRDAHHRDLYTF